MIISSPPQLRGDTLTLNKQGDMLTINSVEIDFSPLYNAVCALGGATPTQRAWATLAESYHAPAQFVAVVRGT